MFKDRQDAGKQLGRALKNLLFTRPVVLGLPRGGVPVAAEVAKALEADLGVVVARKLGAPGSPELAIGATTATGDTYVNPDLAKASTAGAAYIEVETAKQILEARRQDELFNGKRAPEVAGRNVIIVDDGVATGATAIAAIRAMKRLQAARVFLAVPVGPPETIHLIRQESDGVVCLDEDPGFMAVGYYYEHFEPVTDDDVLSCLRGPRRVAITKGRKGSG